MANDHFIDEESEESSSEESVDVPIAARRKFADEEDSDDVNIPLLRRMARD